MMIISVVVFMRGRLLQRLGAVHTHSTDATMRLSNFAQNRPRTSADVRGPSRARSLRPAPAWRAWHSLGSLRLSKRGKGSPANGLPFQD
jgi:hypothetical protein